MKRKRTGLLLSIACIGGLLFFLACKYTYDSQWSKVKEKARMAFDEAIKEELISRNIKGCIKFYGDAKNLMTNTKDSVVVADSLGTYKYYVSPEKRKINITSDKVLRALHSFLFEEKPLISDSLNVTWRKFLSKSGISDLSALSISVSDYKGNVNTPTTRQSKWCKSSNMVFYVTIGIACEIEVKGYVDYSLDSNFYILYLFLCIVFVVLSYKMVIAIQEKIKNMKQEKIRTITNIEYVNHTPATPIRSYMLTNNSVFYAERKMIKDENGNEYKLQLQTNYLLEVFMQHSNEEYILSDDVIKEKLWTDGSGNSVRIHKTINRLRSDLKKIDASIEIKKVLGGYQLLLKKPIE